uniref:LOB domain-containing protein n=1 Tax=Chenopodium quinoa TaxID=63459 RepID=A0A803KSF4_CHEQI
MSSSNSPCAACKFLRRKCTQECVFAPYFPPDQPQRFSNVHKVFGASNVAKLLNDLDATQREDAVNSLAYEAEARLRDPVYGCVGLISLLQHRLKQVQTDLYSAKKELATYIGPTALMPMIQPGYANPGSSSGVNLMQQQYHMGPMMGIPTGVAAAGPALVIAGGSGGGGFNQAGPSSGAVSPSLALGAATFDPNPYAQIQPQQPPPQQQPPQDDQSLGQLLLLQQPLS